jgi:hypothetical protein
VLMLLHSERGPPLGSFRGSSDRPTGGYGPVNRFRHLGTDGNSGWSRA